MSIERIYYCDGPDCETHVRTADTMLRSEFVFVEWGIEELHFCSWDCVMRYAATIEPTEVVRD